jgi:DNA repair protein RecN (Recombination protein N)
MISHLSVQNYALIRQLEIDFVKGFTVITGETGAGKSILLGALNLMLGKRADAQVLFDKSKKCIVEGVFSIENNQMKDFFEANQLDYDDEAILRREVQANGKSRAFINDTPVNISLLKTLGERLIDIHSQHQTLALNDPAFQLSVIDNFASLSERTTQYKSAYKNYQFLKSSLETLLEEEKKSNEEKDYFEFLFNELETAKLTNGEQEQLENELEILNHSEEIKAKLYDSSQVLGNDDSGILLKLSEIRSNIAAISKLSADYSEISERIESSFIELNDILGNLERIAESINYSPEKILEIKERLDLIYHLQNKHRVNSVEDLLGKQEELHLKIESGNSLTAEIKKVTAELEISGSDLKKLAGEISAIRRKHFKEIESRMEDSLWGLGIPDARFKIQHDLLEFPGRDGFDTICFLFNANKGGELMELSSVASGGELSRIMLSVKSIVTGKNLLPTLIFDEIDMGVSGKIADKVGVLLQELSATTQVLAITHLPQIAGKGNEHYFVFKESDDDSTRTYIRILEPDERILEIAKMMSGEKVSESSLETAKHLLNPAK